MLSRVADTLYWMSRFVERAEGVTRLVEVYRDSDLESDARRGDVGYWHPTLLAMCAQEQFEGDELDEPDSFLLFSSQWNNSVINSIKSARENARMVRDQLSEEIWVELNTLYHFLNSPKAMVEYRNDESSFFRRIIRFSLVFQGLCDATIHHDEGWLFMSLGKYLERADLTSRVLDTLTLLESEPSRLDLIRALRSCTAFSAYRKRYRGALTMHNVADFLLFSQDFPRSIRFSIRCVDAQLHEISGVPSGNFSNEAERLAGSALAQVNFSNIDSMIMKGLHNSIDELQKKLVEVGQSIFETYVLLPFEIKSATSLPLLQSQMQQQ
jgi:uncharacterized alpha-E superfamily protein